MLSSRSQSCTIQPDASEERKPTRTEGRKKGNEGAAPPRAEPEGMQAPTSRQGRRAEALHSRSDKGTKKERERSGTKERQRQADKPTKKGTPPPYCNGQAAVPLITNSRQKVSKKSLGVL